MDNQEIKKTVNGILEYLYDSENGYKETANSVVDSSIQALFRMFANKREKMIVDLKNAARSISTELVTGGSMLAGVHRIFIDLKSLVTQGDIGAIVTEIKRGENLTIDSYKNALTKNLPMSLRLLLNEQLTEIQDDLHRVEEAAHNKAVIL